MYYGCIIGCIGKGSNKFKKTLYENSYCIDFKFKDNLLKLIVSHDYKHLGTRINFTCFSDVECTTKSAIIRNDSKTIYKSFFKYSNNHQLKLTSFKAYLLSKGNYNCGSCGQIGEIAFHKYRSSIITAYRRAFGHTYFDMNCFICDNELIDTYDLINPYVYLASARLQ